MNKARRKQLADIRVEIAVLQELLEEVRDAEQEAFDNLPESLQGSERGQAMDAAIENIESALESLDDAYNSLEEAEA